jgi:hypothetical protein
MIGRHALARSGQALRHLLARSVSESLRRDLHQFRLLSRDAVRQLIDTALLSRDVDPMDFTLWMLALIATPPAFFAARQVLTYTALINAPLEVVHGVALAHRLFFVIYGMLAAALLAALTWEAVFPDGRDQEIVGVLPVRPRTFAAARLGAAMVVCLVFCAAVNVPAALLYTAFCAGHPAFGNIVTLLAGHVLATMMGSFLVFFTLLTARGVAAIILGARAGAWLGAGLQLISVVLMFEVFFFLPGVLGTLVRAITHADSSATSFPPVWFGALHAWVAGEGTPVLEQAMITGVMAFTAALVAVVPIYLVPAGWLGRRALEQRARERAAGTTALVKVVAWATSATPSPAFSAATVTFSSWRPTWAWRSQSAWRAFSSSRFAAPSFSPRRPNGCWRCRWYSCSSACWGCARAFAFPRSSTRIGRSASRNPRWPHASMQRCWSCSP